MYWQDRYPTPAHAVKALKEYSAGKRRMSPTDLHIARVAVRSGLSGLTELPHLGGNFGTNLTVEGQLSDYEQELAARGQLGSLKSFLKKAVKVAGKLSPSHQLAKALKVDKFSPSQILASKLESSSKSSPKTAPAPTTAVLPNAPEQPIPQLPEIVPTSPMSFSQGGGGGGGGSSPAPVPGETQAEETFFTLPVMIGLGVAAMFGVYLLTRKRGR